MSNWQILLKYICYNYIPEKVDSRDIIFFIKTILNERDKDKKKSEKENYSIEIRLLVDTFIKYHNVCNPERRIQVCPDYKERLLWYKEIDLILKDKRINIDYSTLWDVLMFACEDSFWNKQILSLRNLRKRSQNNGNFKIINLYNSYLKSPQYQQDKQLNQYIENIKESSIELEDAKKEELEKSKSKRQKLISQYSWDNFFENKKETQKDKQGMDKILFNPLEDIIDGL